MLYILLSVFAGVSLFAVLALAFVWFRRPAWIVQSLIWASLRRSGLKIRYVTGTSLIHCYAECGRRRFGQPSLVFVHGFSGSKDNWTSIVDSLPSSYHVVIVDLPGHGDSSIPATTDDVSMSLMLDALRELMVAAKLTDSPVHLIGRSMGGGIAGIYASRYSEHVALLTLICPTVATPRPSKFVREYRKGNNRLLPTTEEGVRKLFSIAVYFTDRIPRSRQLLRGILQLRAPSADFYEKLFYLASGKAYKEEVAACLSSVDLPTQVIWGANDQMIDSSGAEMLRKLVPGCRRVDIVEKCGHAIAMDQPKQIAHLLVDFRRNTATI